MTFQVSVHYCSQTTVSDEGKIVGNSERNNNHFCLKPTMIPNLKTPLCIVDDCKAPRKITQLPIGATVYKIYWYDNYTNIIGLSNHI